MQSAIDINGLGKDFGEGARRVRAVEDLSFTVAPGEIFGFMGHNGAGKTTTLRMLLGLTAPTRGSARVHGHDVVQDSLAVRRITGFLPASYALPGEMTARGFLHYVAAMFELPRALAETRVEALIARFGLRDAADRRLRGFSTGMTQKVGLAQALIGDPRVLLLDEPTSGLDPIGRHELLELLRELARTQGMTVLFSSHILSDVDALCDRVAILHQGRLVASGEASALKAREGARDMDELYLSLARKAAA